MKLKSLKFKSVKSTNDVAHMLIKKKNIRPSIILSEKQTKGRGTMGKKWISKKGNLFLTIFFEMRRKGVDFKKFAVLKAYLLRSILAKKFSNKIINIHPALLPKYGGKGMYGINIHNAVIEKKEVKSGITIHYVNENYDEGEIIAQYEIKIDSNETLNSLKQKISREELLNYPKIISSFLNE